MAQRKRTPGNKKGLRESPYTRQAIRSTDESTLRRHGDKGQYNKFHPKQPTSEEAKHLAELRDDPEGQSAELRALLDLKDKDHDGPPIASFNISETVKNRKEKIRVLREVQRRELRKAALGDFWLFLYEVLYALPDQKRNYLEDFHGRIADRLERLGAGENLIICIPREHRKTYTIVAWMVWLILRDPNIRIKIVAKDKGRARKISALVRSIFSAETRSTYPKFHEVFDDFIISSRAELGSALEWIHPKRTTGYIDPTIFGTFFGSTGAGSRCDVMVIDDGWDAQTLTSPDMGVKVYQQFLDLLPTVEGSSLGSYRNIIITTTPWRYYDPTAIMLGVTEDQATADVDKPVFNVVFHHALENPNKPCTKCPEWVVNEWPHGEPDFTDGSAILEPIFDREAIIDRYQQYMTNPDLGEAAFFLQYMCIYASPELAKFNEEWFIQYDQPDWKSQRRRVLVLDDASKDFQQIGRGDFCVARLGSFNEEGRLCLRHGLRSNRWTRREFIDQIVSWCQKARWWPTVAAKEKVGNDDFLNQLREAFNEQGKPLAVIPVPRVGLGRKHDYITSTLQGPMEAGDIVFGSLYPQDQLERDKYELMNLGNTAHDDCADTLALFFAEKVKVGRKDQLTPDSGTRHRRPRPHLYNPSIPGQGKREPEFVPHDPMNEFKQDKKIQMTFAQGGIDTSEVTWTHRTQSGPRMTKNPKRGPKLWSGPPKRR